MWHTDAELVLLVNLEEITRSPEGWDLQAGLLMYLSPYFLILHNDTVKEKIQRYLPPFPLLGKLKKDREPSSHCRSAVTDSILEHIR